MEKGIYYNLPFEEYLKIDAVSASKMKIFRESPYKYKNNKTPENRNLMLGSAYHAAFLEPELFSDKYIKGPNENRATKIWKEAEKEASAQGCILLKPSEYIMCKDMHDSVFKRDAPECKTAQAFFLDGKPLSEATIFWKDQETGLDCKGRIDLLNEKLGVILDIKGTSGVSEPRRFMRDSVLKYEYHVQMAFYLEGLKSLGLSNVSEAVIMSVEKTWPHEFSLIRLPELELRLGRKVFKDTLQQIKFACDNDKWPSACDGLTWGYFPHYAFEKYPELHDLALDREIENE